MCSSVLVSCSVQEDKQVANDGIIEIEVLSAEQLTHIEQLQGNKVVAIQDVVLYHFENDEMIEVGTLHANQHLQLQEGSLYDEKYIQIDGTAWFIDALDVQLSTNTRFKRNHLVPFEERVVCKPSTVFKNEDGEFVMTLSEEHTFDIFVKEVDRYGILIQEDILFIYHEDVERIEEGPVVSKSLASEVPVLMYHFFFDEEVDGPQNDGNYMEVKDFDAQMSYLDEQGYDSLTMKELLYFMEGKAQVREDSFVLTIDDGHPSVAQYAYPLLTKYEFNATLFLIGGWMEPMLPYNFIEMREAGLELQSHSFLMHQGGCDLGHGGRIQCVDLETGINDTIQSLEYVDGGFVYCYPFGDHGGNAQEILQQSGVKMAFTTQNGLVEPGMNMLTLPRVRVSQDTSLQGFIERLN